MSIKTKVLRSVLFFLAASAATAQITPISVVALSGQQAPGLPIGVTFSAIDFAFGFGYLNNTGQVSFLAFVEGPGITPDNDRGIWVGLPGALSLAAREGNQAPDLPAGVVYGTLNETPSLSGNGAVAFRAGLAGTGVTLLNDEALFGGPAGAVRLAARLGDLAPGSPGTTYGGFTGSPINSFHQLVFGGTTGADVESIWFGAPGSISRSGSVGDAADGFPPGVTYGDLFLGGVLPPVALNSAGQIVYSGRVVGPDIGGANDDALWGGLPLSPHLIARAGDAAPGGGFFSSFPSFVITDSGLAAFQAFHVSAPAGDFGVYRIIIGAPSSLDKVAAEGDVAPLAGGAVFNADFGFNGNFIPRMNNANGVAFRSRLSGTGVNATNDNGIWGHNDRGSLSLLAREGSPLPAAGAGVTIGVINPTPPALNGANRIAFRATLAGDGITFANDDVIIGANALGDLVIAAREGQVVEVAPGEFRTFASFGDITGPGTQDGSSTSWNDGCRLLFRAELFGGGGGIGLFIADVNATCRPVVTAGPSSQNIALGDEALFTVSAAGSADLSYRWHKDEVELTDGPTGSGSVISGAMSPTLHVLGCGAADAGRYNVVVSNLCGITPSSAATLRLNLGQVTVISVSGGKVNLSWIGTPNVLLQSTTNLTAAIAWADVPDTAGQSSAAVPLTGPQMFYRLASP